MSAVSRHVAGPGVGAQPLPAIPVQIAVVVVLAALLWLGYGGGFVTLDSMWAVVWGRDLVHGGALSTSGTTTPHVLSNIVGAVLTPLGDEADRGLVAVAYLSAGALVWCTACLAREIAGAAAGLAAGVLVVLREQLLYAATSNFLDVLTASLVVWAALLVVRAEAERRRERLSRDGAVAAGEAVVRDRWGAAWVLFLAGLLRPEAWALAGVLWLWIALRDRRPHLRRLLLVVAAPAAWLATDAILNGDALFSVHETSRVNALVRAGAGIPDTLTEHLVSVPRSLASAAGPEVIVVTALLTLVAVWPSLTRRRPFGLVAIPAAQLPAVRILLVGAVVFAGVIAAEGLTGSLLFARFSLGLMGVLVALTAVLLTALARSLSGGAGADAVAGRGAMAGPDAAGGRGAGSGAAADGEAEVAPDRRSGVERRGQLVLAGLVAVLVLVQLPLLIDARRLTGEEGDRYRVARAAVSQGVPCTPVAVPGANMRAFVAAWLGLQGGEVVDAATDGVPARGTYVTAIGREPERLLRNPSFRQLPSFPPAAPVRSQDGWILTARCGDGG